MILKHTKKNGRIKQLLGVLVVWLCCYSYSSLAYDQQYNVGDTGPNGGQVTAVDVTSTVTGTEVALNGGFEETTTTTLYTETVTEQISTTQTTTSTSQTTVETTTANQLNDINLANGDWQAAGSYGTSNRGSGCSYSGSLEADEFCTGAMTNTNNSNVANTDNWNTGTLGGGYTRTGPNGGYVELTQNLTEAEIQAGFDINYGVTVESHQSNKTVPLCSATTGDCKDIFSIKLTLRSVSQVPNSSYTTTSTIGSATQYETLTYSGTQTFNYTYTLDSNSYTRVDAMMELWGVDAGYHNGMYGPIFSDPYIKLTYDAVTMITEQITNIVLSTQETVYTTSEETMTSVFIGDPTTDTTTTPVVDYSEVDSFEIEIVDADGGGIELEFSVEVDETSNTATVEMSSTNLDTGVVQVESIAEISLDFEMDTGTTDMPEITVAEIEADIGSQIDSAVADAVAEIEVDVGPTENIEVASVNTSEGNTDGPESTQEVSETESSSTSESTVEAENVQESSENAEQPVEESGSESEGSDSGDTDSGENTSGSETKSEAGDKEGGDSDKDSSSGEKSKGKGNSTKSKQEQKREYVEKKVAEAKQKIATRILAAMADTYSAINEATKIALMSSLADQDNFNKYLAQKNADLPSWYTSEQVYKDMPQLLDPAGILYNMAQDKLWEEMIMEQYQD
jgi:hypothetical protein